MYMKKIAIINCVNKKQLHAMEAQQLYVSMAFNAKVKFIKQHYDEWYILSAKYGIIHPTQIIEPYNISFRRDKRFLKHNDTQLFVDIPNWKQLVVSQYEQLDGEIHWHLGGDYWHYIKNDVNGIRIRQGKNHSDTTRKYKLAIECDSLNDAINVLQQPTPPNPESPQHFYHNNYPVFYGTSYQLWKMYREQQLDQACLRRVAFGKSTQHKGWSIKASLATPMS